MLTMAKEVLAEHMICFFRNFGIVETLRAFKLHHIFRRIESKIVFDLVLNFEGDFCLLSKIRRI